MFHLIGIIRQFLTRVRMECYNINDITFRGNIYYITYMVGQFVEGSRYFDIILEKQPKNCSKR